MAGVVPGPLGDPRDPNRFFVAFSFLRFSPWHEYGFRVKNGHRKTPSWISLYEVEAAEVVESLLITEARSLVLFQLDGPAARLAVKGGLWSSALRNDIAN